MLGTWTVHMTFGMSHNEALLVGAGSWVVIVVVGAGNCNGSRGFFTWLMLGFQRLLDG